jgi:hypothetical protein
MMSIRKKFFGPQMVTNDEAVIGSTHFYSDIFVTFENSNLSSNIKKLRYETNDTWVRNPFTVRHTPKRWGLEKIQYINHGYWSIQRMDTGVAEVKVNNPLE